MGVAWCHLLDVNYLHLFSLTVLLNICTFVFLNTIILKFWYQTM